MLAENVGGSIVKGNDRSRSGGRVESERDRSVFDIRVEKRGYQAWSVFINDPSMCETAVVMVVTIVN
jgi:hypothetical protein